MKLTGAMMHLNCPGSFGLGDFPRFYNFECEQCGVDIGGLEAEPTYIEDDGVFYSVLVGDHYVQVGKLGRDR